MRMELIDFELPTWLDNKLVVVLKYERAKNIAFQFSHFPEVRCLRHMLITRC